jgi:hypothetical protein
MAQDMRETMHSEGSMESAPINGMMARNTLETGRRIRSLVSVSTAGSTAENTKESG